MNDSNTCPKVLEALQRETFNYFVHEANSLNGLVIDKTKPGSPASIAAVGLALSSYPVAVERGFTSRADAVKRTLATLRFFHQSVQSAGVDATGYKGFYYHFLDMTTGKRVWKCELSTVDSAFLLAGMLAASAYFSESASAEREIRELADELYQRADWNWAQNGGLAVTLGWTPESGFLPYRWQGYDEALFLYVLGLGSLRGANQQSRVWRFRFRLGFPRPIGESDSVFFHGGRRFPQHLRVPSSPCRRIRGGFW